MNETLQILKEDFADAFVNFKQAEKDAHDAHIWRVKCSNELEKLQELIEKEINENRTSKEKN